MRFITECSLNAVRRLQKGMASDYTGVKDDTDTREERCGTRSNFCC